MTDPRNETNSTAKLTHAVILDGGMFVDSAAGDCVRFFSKSRFKLTKEAVGPLVLSARAMDPRLLNLFLYAPTLYQATHRARMDAKDLMEKFKALVKMDDGPNYKQLVVQIMADLIALESAMDVVQQATREGLDFEKTDQFINAHMIVEESRQEPKS